RPRLPGDDRGSDERDEPVAVDAYELDVEGVVPGAVGDRRLVAVLLRLLRALLDRLLRFLALVVVHLGHGTVGLPGAELECLLVLGDRLTLDLDEGAERVAVAVDHGLQELLGRLLALRLRVAAGSEGEEGAGRDGDEGRTC